MSDDSAPRAYQALNGLVHTAVECASSSREFRLQLKDAETDPERMHLASEAMNASMNAIEALTRAVELAINMFALGITAKVTPEEAVPEAAFTPRIVGKHDEATA